MRTLNLGIVMDQGSDFSLVIGVFDCQGPVDITGYEFLSQMRQDTNPSSPVVAEFDFEILNQFSNKGQVRWYLPEVDDVNITTSIATVLTHLRQTTPFVFDIKMLDTSGNNSRIVQGLIYLSPQATQEVFS